jgi:hypothetical protein
MELTQTFSNEAMSMSGPWSTGAQAESPMATPTHKINTLRMGPVNLRSMTAGALPLLPIDYKLYRLAGHNTNAGALALRLVQNFCMKWDYVQFCEQIV